MHLTKSSLLQKNPTVNHFSVSSFRWQLDLPWNGGRAEPCTVGSAACLWYAAPSLPGSRSHLGSTALSSKASMEDLLRTTWKHSSMERKRPGSQWSIDHSPGAATQPARPVALPGSLWVARFLALTSWLLECWGGSYKSTVLVLMTVQNLHQFWLHLNGWEGYQHYFWSCYPKISKRPYSCPVWW